MQACPAREALEQAFTRFGVPESVSTEQGSQFAAEDFTQAVSQRGYRLSMGGKGAWRDHLSAARLRRTIPHERACLRTYEGVGAAKTNIAQSINGYNTERPHRSMQDDAPDQTDWPGQPSLQQAA